MSKLIRIGTQESQLALWQAKTVQQILEQLGHKTALVLQKSTGDLAQDKSLYELGITGVFTQTLDVALLNNDIDIAVHSLKDVPTMLPKGIEQAAVLKRGNVRDTLVFKNNEEFLSQKNAIIATGNLLRQAQWLHRYPTHTMVGLSGNITTRLEKFENNNYNAALFAAADLGRLELRPKNAINLDWMIPAPAQGAIMISALENNEDIISICAEINHEETKICTSIEREFLSLLEGDYAVPIGAIAYIKEEQVIFQGVLLDKEGIKKIEVTRNEKLENHHEIASYCANFILERGGKRLMNELKQIDKKNNIYSTKTLTNAQSDLFNKDIKVESSDFTQINTNRIKPYILKSEIENVIISSKNAVESLITNISVEELKFKNIYCVGRRTKRLIEKKIGKVAHFEPTAKKLADYLVEYIEGAEVTYFCSDLRLDDLPNILTKNNITVNVVDAYSTKLASVKIDEKVEGVMFYSPSTIKSYLLENDKDKVAFCVGESTAIEASKHFKDVRVAKTPTIESVIELVNFNYK